MRILLLFMSALYLTGCSVDNYATKILYQYQAANIACQVPATPPASFTEVKLNNIVGWAYNANSDRTIVYFHGNAENIECLYNAGFLRNLEAIGANFIVIDYPSYGLSTGTPNQTSLVSAADSAIEWAHDEYPDSKLIIMGWSLGAGVATLATADEQPLVSKLILASAWTSFYDVAKADTSLAGSLSPTWIADNNYDSAAVAPSIDLPVFMFHGTADTTIPMSFGIALSNQFKDATFFQEPGLPHDIFTSQQVWQQIDRAVNE